MAVDSDRQRAPYAADPRMSRGRLHPEPPSPTRNLFRRDCDRIIHAAAFRRLQYKTQVFVFHEGDHYRTRLTHTLEVTQIARALARALGLDEDLAEALALAHDLGHPPFGHAGERALDGCLEGFGGFDHNAQTLRIVTLIERRYPEFDGLNLAWETLEGIVKHNGPLTDRAGRTIGRQPEIPHPIREFATRHALELWSQATAEAQAAAIADDIAYDAHDIDDGLRADLFGLSALEEVPLIAEILRDLRVRHPNLETARVNSGLVRRLIARMIDDVITESNRRLGHARVQSLDQVRAADRPVVGFSADLASADAHIKHFLWDHMYRHPRIVRIMAAAQEVVRNLFAHFLAFPHDLPDEWTHNLDLRDERVRARRSADFIAGMTDRYALAEHARHFDTTPELV
jgi:dGTPase